MPRSNLVSRLMWTIVGVIVSISPGVAFAQEIRTPAAPATPQINGPTVFGVRPNAPVLYKIPATGNGTLTYSVVNLPAGLSVDPASGEITGTLATVGDYQVTLKATSALGTDTKDFTIKVGDTIGLTPTMGWNSWYAFKTTVTQDLMIQQAQAMVSSGLINYGWTYMNVDDTWQGTRGGAFNAIQGDSKFPDMAGMVSQIHGLGLKAGIYSTPWIQSYAGFTGGSANNPQGTFTKVSDNSQKVDGTFSFAQNDANQWAAWGIDYLKYDWNPRNPNPVSNAQFLNETTAMDEALRNSGRDILYSYSNSMPRDQATVQTPHLNSWRTTGDITDTWDNMSSKAFGQGAWAQYAAPGHRNDPDMLMIGYGKFSGSTSAPTRLTPDEQYTQMTMWSLLGAPLLLSTDLTRLDAFTMNLITNPEVLAVDQDALGQQAIQVDGGSGNLVVYAKVLEDGSKAVGLFNKGTTAADITVNWSSIGMGGTPAVRDLWRELDLGNIGASFTLSVAAHSGELIRVAQNAVTWGGQTSNVWNIETTANWKDGASSLNYVEGQVVTFGNGPTNRNVSISGTVQPGLITVNNDASNPYTIGGGVIAGLAVLTKQGIGTLTLNGANTFTGATRIQAGTIKVGNFAALGSLTGAAVTIEIGGTLDIGGIGTENVSGGFGAKEFFISGSGADGSGAIVNSGLRQQNAFQSITLTGDATVGGNGSGSTDPGRFDLRGGSPELDLGGYTLTKKGTNQFSLVGATVTNGDITTQAGVLSIETTSIVAGTGTLTFQANTTAQYFNNTGTVTRPIVIDGEGVQMGNAGTSTATIGSPITLKGNLTLANLRGVSNGTLILTGDIGESGGARSIVRNATGTGSIVTLSGNNSYSGGTTLNAGTLRLGSPTALGASTGPLTVNGGTLDLNGQSATVGALAGSGGAINTGVAGAVTLSAGQGGASSNYFGVLQDGAGVLSLTKTGDGVLALFGNDTYTGVTHVDAGTLLVNGTHTGGGTYTVASGATLGGTGSFSAGIDVDGILSPGASIESLVISGSADFGSTGVLQIELNASSGAVDLLQVGGALNIDPGALVQFLITGTPTADEYVFGQYSGSLAGSFSSTSVPRGYELAQEAGQLKLVALPEPGTLTLAVAGLLGVVVLASAVKKAIRSDRRHCSAGHPSRLHGLAKRQPVR